METHDYQKIDAKTPYNGRVKIGGRNDNNLLYLQKYHKNRYPRTDRYQPRVLSRVLFIGIGQDRERFQYQRP